MLKFTNHKSIGGLYFLLGIWGGLVGTSLSILIRISIRKSGGILPGILYNVIIRRHALIIIFFIVIPLLIGGFGNWILPLLLGAPDIRYPRLNNGSYWLLFGGLFNICFSLLVGFGAGTSWTLYPPLRVIGHLDQSVDLVIFAVHLAGVSSILGGLNFIVSRKTLRFSGMSLEQLSLFVWATLVTVFLLVLSLPVLAGALTMALTDRNLNTTILIRLKVVMLLFFNTCFGFSDIQRCTY